MKIFIILPAYNEAVNLPQLLANLHKVLKGGKNPYSIFIVDDGSTDDTYTIVKKYQMNYPITLVRHQKNKGLGMAMDSGFQSVIQKAKDDDLIITMDADNTHDVFAIQKIIAKWNLGYDLILASRFAPGGGDQGISFLRRLLSHQAGRIFQILFPIPGVREYTASFRGYRMSLLKKAYLRFDGNFIREKGFNCMLEILVKLSTLSPKIIEIPFTLFYDRKKGRSKMDVKKTLWRYLVIIMNRKRFVEPSE